MEMVVVTVFLSIFNFEPNGNLFGSKSKGKQSSRSYPIQCERKCNISFLSVPSEDFHSEREKQWKRIWQQLRFPSSNEHIGSTRCVHSSLKSVLHRSVYIYTEAYTLICVATYVINTDMGTYSEQHFDSTDCVTQELWAHILGNILIKL